MASRPNILWYCTDQQRFDTIKALGNPHVHTPTIDALVATESPSRTPTAKVPSARRADLAS